MTRHLILDLNVILMKIFHVQSKDNPCWTRDHWNDIVRQQFKDSVVDYIITKFLADKTYDRCWICADGHNSWRKSVVDTYKANRKPKEDDPIDMGKVWSCFNETREELEKVFNINVISAERVEGDDMIYFLTNELAKDPDNQITIFTIDHDLWQILRPNVYIIDQHFKPVTVKSPLANIGLELECMCSNETLEKKAEYISTTSSVTYIDDSSLIWKYKILDGDGSDNIRGAFVRRVEVNDNKNGGKKIQNRKLTQKEKDLLFEELGDKEFVWENVWPIVKTMKNWKDYCGTEDDYNEGPRRMEFVNNDILIRMAEENYPQYIKDRFNDIWNNSENKKFFSVTTFINNMPAMKTMFAPTNTEFDNFINL